MCSADAAVNAVLTQHHDSALSDLGDTLMEMQNSAFALGYLRARNDAAAEVARLQALLDAVPVAALWRPCGGIGVPARSATTIPIAERSWTKRYQTDGIKHAARSARWIGRFFVGVRSRQAERFLKISRLFGFAY